MGRAACHGGGRFRGIVKGMKCPYLPVACAILAAAAAVSAQTAPAFNSQEQAIADRMAKLRSLPDGEWTLEVGRLARHIQALPPGEGKHRLIGSLSSMATEGDAGAETLQAIADVIAGLPPNQRMYGALALLARYEHVRVSLDDPAYRAAMAGLEADDRRRMSPQFTLSDLAGKAWSLETLRGKVVLVNFWATWCPPCRRELPDMQALYERFGPRGFTILAISDDDPGKVREFVTAQKYTFPVLLDPDRKVNQLFAVAGIPKSFLYGRDGKLVAQAIDRRTNRQFLEMLKLAGLE